MAEIEIQDRTEFPLKNGGAEPAEKASSSAQKVAENLDVSLILQDQPPSTTQPDAPNPKANLRFLNCYVLALGLGPLQLGWAISANNQLANVMATKFEWTTEETKLYNMLINFSTILGMAIGMMSGGLIIPWGRRKTIILFNIFGLMSLALMQILNLWPILLGKLFFGFCAGVINMASPKMLDETVPVHLIGAYGIVSNCGVCCGIFLVNSLGAALPGDGDVEGYKKDVIWRVIYGFPAVFSIIMLITFIFIFKTDSIIFSMKNGKTSDAQHLISKVYSASEDLNKI